MKRSITGAIALALILCVSPLGAALDAFGNFAKARLSTTGIDAATTSIPLVSGTGTRFPAPPFNATIWNATDYADPSDDPGREIVRVTVISGDTLTATRAQESTSATTHNTKRKTYIIVAALTAKTLSTDIPATFAPLASPAFTGVPTAPTAAGGTNTTQVATTAFVIGQGSAGITALTSDVTATGPGSVAATLATVNANTGAFGSSTAIPNFTVNGKGLITAAGTTVVIAPAGTLTGAALAAGVTGSSLTSFGASPTLTTPTIASFTNATHNHSNAAGGGQIDATTALSNGTNGSGQVCLVNTPTLITPNIGAATMGGTLTAGNTNSITFNGSAINGQGTNIIAQSNGVNAQAFRIFNTTDSATSPTNSEFASFDWTTAANTLTISTAKTGTGVVRAMTLNSNTITVQVNGSSRYQINNTAFVPTTDNSLDLGSSASQRFRTAYIATSIQAGAVKTLPETTATGFVTLAIANSNGCAGKAVYTVFAADATNTQLVSGELFFAAAATNAGAVTAAISDQHNLNPVTSGTLTNTMTNTTGTNLLTLLANATSSLTQTTLEVRYRIELQGGTCTVTGL